MYVSSSSSAIRKREPGYSISFERKKQYEQSRLQTAPVGFASRWNARGGAGGPSSVAMRGTGSPTILKGSRSRGRPASPQPDDHSHAKGSRLRRMAGNEQSEVGDALRRTPLANERTYLAWWRSALTALAVAVGTGRIAPGLAGGAVWPYRA